MGVNVTGQINFLTKTTDSCLPWVDVSTTSKWATSNFFELGVRIPIYDLRDKENPMELDKNGFEVANYCGNVNDEFDDRSDTQRIYYEEICSFLKKHLNASHVIIFNHLFRSRDLPRSEDECDLTHKNPVFYPHVDLDPPGAHWKLKQMCGDEEASKRMKNRFQVINVWRPLGSNPITEKPLTICDYGSLDVEHDVHPLEVRGSVNALSAYTISHNTNGSQKWYYFSNMGSDKMFLIKVYDTKKHVAQYGFHTAFVNESAPPSNSQQKSIEVRCLVFYDE